MKLPKVKENVISKTNKDEKVIKLLEKKSDSDIIRKFCPSKFNMDSVLSDFCDTRNYEECKECWTMAIAIENE